MKILHINSSDSGGAGMAALRLHNALLRNSIDSEILFLNQSNKHIKKSFSFFESFKLNFYSRSLLRFKERQFYQSNSKRFSNRDKSFEIFTVPDTPYNIFSSQLYAEADIIHLHWVSGFIDYRLFFSNCNKPVVWTLHDMNPFTGGCHYASGCKKFMTSCNDCPQIKGIDFNANDTLQIKKHAVDLFRKKGFALNIITPSTWLGKESASGTVFNNCKHYVIPNCLDAAIFKPHDKIQSRKILNLPEDKMLILFLSDDITKRRKGLDMLIDSVKHIDRNDVAYIIVGNDRGDEFYPENSFYLGTFADEVSLSIVYSAADVMVMPSREDNLPNTIVEALCCGLPVIAFETTGIPDLITDGTNGYLSDNISSGSLTNMILRFIENRNQFSSALISRAAHEKYNLNTIAEKYIQVYKELL